jgi:hypothetical protein
VCGGKAPRLSRWVAPLGANGREPEMGWNGLNWAQNGAMEVEREGRKNTPDRKMGCTGVGKKAEIRKGGGGGSRPPSPSGRNATGDRRGDWKGVQKGWKR